MNDKNPEKLIPIPCHQRWEDMGKDEVMKEGHTARMCHECQHHIHDISDMSYQQIVELKSELNLKGEKLCGMVRQPSHSSVTKIQRFSLICVAAIAPIALVACGGNPSQGSYHPVIKPGYNQGIQTHNVAGLVAAPPIAVGEVATPPAPRIAIGEVAMPPGYIGKVAVPPKKIE